MDAVYLGIGSLFSEQAEASVEDHVNTVFGAAANMIGIMETLRTRGRAGPPARLTYNGATDRWTPDPETTILGMTSPSFRGWYFFGLSLHRAYHSVTLVVDKMDPSNPRIYWVDQFESGFTNEVTGHLQEELHRFEPPYGYRYSQLWKMLPPREMLVCEPE